jgi:4-amino-4-deoxy-L-arabinose transferase-like glycosyltransferase
LTRRLLDLAALLALMVYALAGTPLASFHGDEPMQIYMSSDYWQAFVRRQPDALKTHPPYPIDSDGHLRILNGSVNRCAIGFAWHLAGLDESLLPPRPGWDWGLSYDDNVSTGHRPPDWALLTARLPSALLLAGTIPLIFALGWLIGGRLSAHLAAALFALNPVLLLNGRRAMQEGALLFFGALTVLIAAWIAAQPRRHPLAWLALAGACGLALASKHSAALMAAGALTGLWLALITARFTLRNVLVSTIALGGAAALAFGLFIALSPALWDDPAARLRDLLAVRAELLDIQVAVSGGVPLSLPERAMMIVREPFLAPVMHFEVSWWRDIPQIDAEISRYMASPLSGAQTEGVIGAALTACALIGLIAALARRAPVDWVILGWSAAAAGSLLLSPLPWQRYALPWIPAAILLAALGLRQLTRQALKAKAALAARVKGD